MCTQVNVYLLIFPIKVFIREMWKTWYMLPNVPLGYRSFFTAYQKWNLHFSHRVFERLYKSTLLIFFPQGWSLTLKIHRFNCLRGSVKKRCNITKCPVAKITAFGRRMIIGHRQPTPPSGLRPFVKGLLSSSNGRMYMYK
jgi:hypothetical protein